MTDIILVQPCAGYYERLGHRPPSAILAVSAIPHHRGYKVKIIDQRVDKNWEKTLINHLKKEPICVGTTCMTGSQVLHALKISSVVKNNSNVPIVWGGIHPTLIPERRLIANVDGVMNAVLVMGDAVGPTLYYGAGAGDEPTASAVVADLVDVVRVLTSDPENRVPHLAFQPGALSDIPILPMAEVQTAYYLRMQADDRPGVLADVTRILGDAGISIEAIIQKEPLPGSDKANIARKILKD